MELLARRVIPHNGQERAIELLHGDLSHLPLEHSVDILVVSAFPNDYEPTETSLIGGLYGAGLSIAHLAASKEIDLRSQFSCWLSEPIVGRFNFKRVLCIESGWRGTPPEITDDLFRALAPYVLTDYPNASIAVPLIGTGDQGWPAALMLERLVETAISWINRGLALRVLKIIVHSERKAHAARKLFLNMQDRSEKAAPAASESTRSSNSSKHVCDLFISYSHQDSSTAELIVNTVQLNCPKSRIFLDKGSLKPGASWLLEIAESLDDARLVAALYTPNYWSSPACKDEFAAALTRQIDTGKHILFPIYLSSASIPYLFRNLQFVDCREGDHEKLKNACLDLSDRLSAD